jgi:glutaconate CoA-transferase, subunit B
VSELAYTPDEMMTVAAARQLANGRVCFVGIGKPSAAANLARMTHAPEVILIYESGTIGAKPNVLPLSIGDGELAETAETVVSVPEIFRYWLQGGRVDIGFLGAAQIDKFANINTTVIGGSYASPRVRLPGAGGAPEIAAAAREVCILLKHTKNAFVETLDFVTTCNRHRDEMKDNLPALGRRHSVVAVITDLAVLQADAATGELTLSTLHPGVAVDEVKQATGWDLKISQTLRRTPEPTSNELVALRDLHGRTSRAYSSTD